MPGSGGLDPESDHSWPGSVGTMNSAMPAEQAEDADLVRVRANEKRRLRRLRER